MQRKDDVGGRPGDGEYQFGLDRSRGSAGGWYLGVF